MKSIYFIKKTAREMNLIAYDYFERNKDALCEKYNRGRYNPTDMTREYMNWCRKQPTSFWCTSKGDPLNVDLFLEVGGD